MCRHGFSLLCEPQNDFFLTPTSVNLVRAGKLVPDISTELAFRHVNRAPPVHSKLHTPPAGGSVRTASHLPLRHRDLDRQHIVNCIKGIECLLLLGGHRHISMCRSRLMRWISPGTCGAPGRDLGQHPRITSAMTGMFTCTSAPFVTHPFHTELGITSAGELTIRTLRTAVELRWRSGEHQAALTWSVCTTGPRVSGHLRLEIFSKRR